MDATTAIVRLNLLVEFLSECADVGDFDSLLRVVGGRVRWIVGFERCTLCLWRGEQCSYWSATRAQDRLTAIPAGEAAPADVALLERALEQGTPLTSGPPLSALCSPLVLGPTVIGALCFSSTETYEYRDARFVQYIAQSVTSTVARLDLKRESDQASQRKDDFLALLSHELRNPLAPILAAVHVLRLKAVAGPEKEILIIERQARHMVRLVNQLLDLSRLTRGALVLSKAPIEIGLVIAHALEMSSPLFKEYGHSVDVQVPAAGLQVSGDADRLSQVVSNLLNNAARYTNAGGQIAVLARREREDVLIEVRDNGVGIPAETLPEVFNPFMRGPGAADRSQTGLGLGLTLVKTLVELHGGTVQVFSEGAGRGSKLSVRLPALRDAVPEPSPEPPSVAPRVDPRRRVLLVDDNQDAAELLSMIVEGAGHEVRVAHDGPQALDLLRAFHPSVAVLDLGLPLMDGFALAENIRARLGREAPFLIALTGYGQESHRERSRAAGFSRHFVKPVDPDALLQAIGAAGAWSAAPPTPPD